MGQDPDAIRNEIESTRERMGDTVVALAYKADVKSRAKDSVNEKVDTVKSKITGVKDSVTGGVSSATSSVTGGVSSATSSVTGSVSDAAGTVSERTPSAGDVKQGARRAASIAQENPLGLAIGATAVGFI